MLPRTLIPRLVVRHGQWGTLHSCVNGLRLQPCRHYSRSFILKKLRRLSVYEQQHGINSVLSTEGVNLSLRSMLDISGRQSYAIQQVGLSTTSSEDPTKSKENKKEKRFTSRNTREPFLGKDILRKIKKKQTEQYFIYTENNFIDVQSAMQDYLLDRSDIDKLHTFKRTSPFSSMHKEDEEHYLECAWVVDIEKLAVDKWGSMEKLKREKMIRSIRDVSPEKTFKDKMKNWYSTIKEAFFKDSGLVVMVAFSMNFCNAAFKGILYFMTGSPSMFSEFMHSLVDTANQLLLAIGRYKSLQKPDAEHPYGYRNHIHIFALYSGIFIFSSGFGFTFYHAILSLYYPVLIDLNQLTWSLYVLAGSFVTEGASLCYALMEVYKKAMQSGMSMIQYVREGDDPLTNVVLMEDLVGVLGVAVCGLAMTSSYYLGMPQLDALGSFAISGMLGFVSCYLLQSNSDKLVGTKLSNEEKIKEELEKDRFVQAVFDSKSQDFGDQSRFKSEVVLDAKLMARHYLETEVDLDAMFVKWKSVKTVEEMILFQEDINSEFYNQIVSHVDRHERELKKKFPEIRHIDIEPS